MKTFFSKFGLVLFLQGVVNLASTKTTTGDLGYWIMWVAFFVGMSMFLWCD